MRRSIGNEDIERELTLLGLEDDIELQYSPILADLTRSYLPQQCFFEDDADCYDLCEAARSHSAPAPLYPTLPAYSNFDVFYNEYDPSGVHYPLHVYPQDFLALPRDKNPSAHILTLPPDQSISNIKPDIDFEDEQFFDGFEIIPNRSNSSLLKQRTNVNNYLDELDGDSVVSGNELYDTRSSPPPPQPVSPPHIKDPPPSPVVENIHQDRKKKHSTFKTHHHRCSRHRNTVDKQNGQYAGPSDQSHVQSTQSLPSTQCVQQTISLDLRSCSSNFPFDSHNADNDNNGLESSKFQRVPSSESFGKGSQRITPIICATKASSLSRKVGFIPIKDPTDRSSSDDMPVTAMENSAKDKNKAEHLTGINVQTYEHNLQFEDRTLGNEIEIQQMQDGLELEELRCQREKQEQKLQFLHLKQKILLRQMFPAQDMEGRRHRLTRQEESALRHGE